MGKTRRFALMLGLSAAVCVDTTAALADPSANEAAGNNSSTVEGTESAETRREARGRTPEEAAARRAERHANRRERLEQGAKRLRERAAEMRKKAASGETPPVNGKRQPRSYEEQAQRLEGQAAKMEERAKNVDSDEARGGRDKDPASARQRRHQVRRGHLNRRWGATLRDPAAVEELKVHAERAAKLKRIRSLALKKSKDDPTAKRATELLTKETERHEKRMSELHGKTPPGAAPASTAPAQEKAE
jgi:hypothetical protein